MHDILYHNCYCMEFDTASSALNYMVNVTGETLWLNQMSNPGPFAIHTNTTTELTSHMVIHQQRFTLNLPRYTSNPLMKMHM